MRNIISIIFLSLLLLGCFKNSLNDSALNIMLEGEILSVRSVDIDNVDQDYVNATAMFSGDIFSAVSDANIGNGTGQVVASISAAMVGAVIGAIAVRNISKSSGFEYVIKVNSSKIKDKSYDIDSSICYDTSSSFKSDLITAI